MFQFHKVQLKVRHDTLDMTEFMFQFHTVQLKALQYTKAVVGKYVSIT